MQIQNSYIAKVQQAYKVDKTEPAQKQDKVDSNKRLSDIPMLDERANDILDKLISEEGLSSEKASSMKMMMIGMMTDFRVDSNGRLIDETPNQNLDMSQNAVSKRIDKLLHNLEFGLNTGDFQEQHNKSYKTATDLKTLYNAEYKPLNITA